MPWFRRARAEVPADWEAVLERRVAHWRWLDADEQARLGELLAQIVRGKRWEAANGFELTDEMRVVIAAQAALLVLELGYDAYDDVGTIIVHPSTMHVHQVSAGDVAGTEVAGVVHLLGEAQYGGPVVVAWDSASRAARHPDRGHDVVLHEFAHKLDMLDTVVDGTPPLVDDAQRERWIHVSGHEYQRLRDGDGAPVLDPYGATDPGEFFAVATEAFFTVPIELRADCPDLYEAYAAFYRQDPAERLVRHHAT